MRATVTFSIIFILIVLLSSTSFAQDCNAPLTEVTENVEGQPKSVCSLKTRLQDPLLLSMETGEDTYNLLYPIYGDANPTLMPPYDNGLEPGKASEALITILQDNLSRQIDLLELTVVSSLDCIGGYSGAGTNIVCPENAPYAGDYRVTFYDSIQSGGAANDYEPAGIIGTSETFTVGTQHFIPIINPDDNRVIARSMIINVSSMGMHARSDKPIYASVQYLPVLPLGASKYDKTIHLPFSAAPQSPFWGTDWMRMVDSTDTSTQYQLKEVTADFEPSDVTHFAAGYAFNKTPVITDNVIVQQISTCEQLLNLDLSRSVNVAIAKDIDCSNQSGQYSPIQINDAINLDGQGHTISNVNLWVDTHENIGIFATIRENSTVKNLTLHNIRVSGRTNTGALAGLTEANTLIKNVHVTGTQSLVYGEMNTGGLIGTARSTTIENCSSEVSVNGREFTGGLVGQLLRSTLSRSYYTGNLHAYGYQANTIGGLAGFSTESSITESYSTTNITCVNCDFSLGGLLGTARFTFIRDSLFSGTINIRNGVNFTGDAVGGIVGTAEASSPNIIERSYAAGNIAGTSIQIAGITGVSSHYTTLLDVFSTIKVLSREDFFPGYAAYISGADISHEYRDVSDGMDAYESRNIFYTYYSDDRLEKCMVFADLNGQSACTSVNSPEVFHTFVMPNWDYNNTWMLIANELPRLRNVGGPLGGLSQ